LGDTLLEAVVLGEIGVDGYPLAVDKFSGRCADGARRPPALDAEQVLGLTDRVFAPASFDNGLSYRYGRWHPGLRHRALGVATDELDELFFGHALDVDRLWRG